MKRVVLFVIGMAAFFPVGELIGQESKSKQSKERQEDAVSILGKAIDHSERGMYHHLASMQMFQRQRDILAELDKLKSQERTLKTKLGQAHPSYVLVKQEIAVLEKRLAKVADSLGTVYGTKPNNSNVFQAVTQLEELSVVFRPKNDAEKELRRAMDRLFEVRNKYNVQFAAGRIGLIPKSNSVRSRAKDSLLPVDSRLKTDQELRLDKLLKRNQEIVQSREQLAALFQTLNERKKKLDNESAMVQLFEGNQSDQAKKKLAAITNQKQDLELAAQVIKDHRAVLFKKLNELDQMNSVLKDQVDLFYQRAKKNGETVMVMPSNMKTKKNNTSVNQRLDRVEKQLKEMSAMLKRLVKKQK